MNIIDIENKIKEYKNILKKLEISRRKDIFKIIKSLKVGDEILINSGRLKGKYYIIQRISEKKVYYRVKGLLPESSSILEFFSKLKSETYFIEQYIRNNKINKVLKDIE